MKPPLVVLLFLRQNKNKYKRTKRSDFSLKLLAFLFPVPSIKCLCNLVIRLHVALENSFSTHQHLALKDS